MSRIAAVTAVAIAVSLAVVAPVAAQSGIGLKAGASFGNISNKGILPGNLDNRTGFAGGIAVALGDVIGVGAELLYVQRGLKSDATAGTADARLDYIDIPVYLRVSFPTPGVRPFVYGGPQWSKEVKCANASVGDCISNTNRSESDFAAVVGAGLRFGGSLGITVEGRYVYGLKDLAIAAGTDEFKTRSFLILAGIAF